MPLPIRIHTIPLHWTPEGNRHGAATWLDNGDGNSAFLAKRGHSTDFRTPLFDDGHFVKHVGDDRIPQTAFPFQQFLLREAVIRLQILPKNKLFNFRQVFFAVWKMPW